MKSLRCSSLVLLALLLTMVVTPAASVATVVSDATHGVNGRLIGPSASGPAVALTHDVDDLRHQPTSRRRRLGKALYVASCAVAFLSVRF